MAKLNFAKRKPPSIMERLFAPHIRNALWLVLGVGMMVNILLLTSPLYMLQLYDRVLTSRNEATLISLSVLAFFALFIYGLLEVIRTRIMVDISIDVDQALSKEVFTSLFREATLRFEGVSAQPFRDMDTIRSVISGPGIIALLDLPWTPFFITLVFLLHPILGWVAIGGAILTLIMAIISERLSRPLIANTASHQIAASRFVESCLNNADAIHAMGMLDHIRNRWLLSYDRSVQTGAASADRISSFSGTTKAMRIIMQSAILGTGAWLALRGDITSGSMVAASIIFGRALSPLEHSISASRGLLSAHGALKRLEALLIRHGDQLEPVTLPAPTGELKVENLVLIPPGGDKALLQGINFKLESGEVLGILGPSASGKSSLGRAILGLWKPTRGAVRLDGAELSQWDFRKLGIYLGYLPQDVELLSGTVQENISRFGIADETAAIEAARLAGCHDMILGLSDGYNTDVGTSGKRLSGGQCQRIALARCLVSNPVLVLLDEPDANLDIEGLKALDTAIEHLKARQVTVILITHNIRLLRHADKAMLLTNGAMSYWGPPQELLDKLSGRSTPGTSMAQATRSAPIASTGASYAQRSSSSLVTLP